LPVPLSISGEGTHFIKSSSISILISIHRQQGQISSDSPLFVWDIQTGVVILEADTSYSCKVIFHGNQRIIALVLNKGYTHTHNVLGAAQLHLDIFPLVLGTKSVTHWTHEGSVWFAIYLNTGMGHVITIKEFQPNATPPLCTLSSFSIPPYDGKFTFSSVSFHASFVSRLAGVIVLDVQDSKVLLQTQLGVGYSYIGPGQFSPNGHLFACSTLEGKIYIWQNTPTGYIPWSSLRPQLVVYRFLFSPTTTPILCRGAMGVQLVHPGLSQALGNHPSPTSDTDVGYLNPHLRHLVAYSTDRMYIAMALQGSSIVTVLKGSSGNPQQLTNPDLETEDIKIIDNTLFVVGRHNKLVRWNLEAGGEVGSSHSARRVVVEALVIDPDAYLLTLSHDCTQIAFTTGQTVFLQDLRDPRPITQYESIGSVMGLQFFPDKCGLWLYTEIRAKHISNPNGSITCPRTRYLVELGIVEGGGFWDITTTTLSDVGVWGHLSSYGCCVEVFLGKWVLDSRDKKLLWLPPSWRTCYEFDALKWDGNFLALVEGHHPEPIIIQFYP